MVQSRRLRGQLNQDGRPGWRSATIELVDGDKAIFEQHLGWEAVSAIAIVPKVLVVKEQQNKYKLNLKSQSNQTFRIIEVRHQVEGLVCSWPADLNSDTHTVEFDTEKARFSGNRDTLTIVTTHPSKHIIETSIVILN